MSKIKKPSSTKDSQRRLGIILRRLNKDYPNVDCALNYHNPWQLLVATILSAQCTDARVNQVTPKLFAKYPTIVEMACVRQEVLEQDIKSTGFFRNKAKSLIGSAQRINSEFGGKVPETMDEMLTLPGVARKTANVVLGTWFRKATGVVVDTHVQRISRRLDLTKEKDPVKIEKDLMKKLPRTRWILFSHQIIHHGREVCQARKPHCEECTLANLCYAPDRSV